MGVAVAVDVGLGIGVGVGVGVAVGIGLGDGVGVGASVGASATVVVGAADGVGVGASPVEESGVGVGGSSGGVGVAEEHAARERRARVAAAARPATGGRGIARRTLLSSTGEGTCNSASVRRESTGGRKALPVLCDSRPRRARRGGRRHPRCCDCVLYSTTTLAARGRRGVIPAYAGMTVRAGGKGVGSRFRGNDVAAWGTRETGRDAPRLRRLRASGFRPTPE